MEAADRARRGPRQIVGVPLYLMEEPRWRRPSRPEVSEASLDPDGDGFYYVHSGQGESEAFVVPDTFRVTYTGSSSTCALDIANPRTGAQYEFVSGLGGGGFERVFLDSDLNLVYVADIIGCRGGRLEFVPNS